MISYQKERERENPKGLLSGFLSRACFGFRFEVVPFAARECVSLGTPLHTQSGENQLSPCNVKANDKGVGY